MPLFSPVSAGGIGKATVTATTGSPSVDSSTRAGKTIYNFTGSGSITVGTAGTCEVLIIGGGITTAEKAIENCKAGADIIVIGNAVEKDPSLIKAMAEAIHSLNK